MRKVLFLMFLLLLMGLGAAGVKAQVRIGGNAAPNASAVLDLNADDTNTGTKGLALPRVSLTNVSTPLTGTPVVNGMLVYNTNPTTIGGTGVGIYCWTASAWKRVDIVPAPTPADSGLFLMSDGNGAHFAAPFTTFYTQPDATTTLPTPLAVTVYKVADAWVPINMYPNTITRIHIQGLLQSDYCISIGGFYTAAVLYTYNDWVWVYNLAGIRVSTLLGVACYRFS